MAAWIESSSMIFSTISRLLFSARSPSLSNCLNSALTVLWSFLSKVIASIKQLYPYRSTENHETYTRSVRTGEDRIVTIPNVISVVRLCCIPVFLWLLFGRDDQLAAAGLLAVLGATDWVDGYVARHYDQVSTLGKVLDP